jgi:hypothetical protein
MRNSLAFATLYLASAFIAAPGFASETPGYVTGQGYVNLSDAERTAYVAGSSDMLMRMGEQVTDPSEKAFDARAYRCMIKMTSNELRDFVDEYIAHNPANRGYGMATVFRSALKVKCPK